MSDTVLKGLGLCVLGIGITGTIQAVVNGQIANALAGSFVGSPDNPLQLTSVLSGERTLVIVISMALGAAIGHLCRLDDGINHPGEKG